MKQKLPLILSSLLFFSLSFNLYLFNKTGQSQEGYKVIEIFDGDTFSIEPDQSVRLANINAPGLDFCLGKEAKKRLEELVLGKRIRLEETKKDRFKRTLALVYVGDISVNKTMLDEGWGRYDSTGTSKDEEMKEAEHRAREAKKGVYSSLCTQLKPPDPKCAIKGNVGKHDGKKIYHFQGCSGYNVVILEKDRGEDWFCSEKEAKAAGFKKSEKCYDKPYTL